MTQKNSLLSEKEAHLISAAAQSDGNIYLLPDGWGEYVKTDISSYQYEEDIPRRNQYKDALKNLERKGMVVFEKGVRFRLTTEGYSAATRSPVI
jgi:hypothetical protein